MGEEDLAAKDMEISSCFSQTSIPTGVAGWFEESAPFLDLRIGFNSPVSYTHPSRNISGRSWVRHDSRLNPNLFLLAFLKGSFADVLFGDQTTVRAIPPSL